MQALRLLASAGLVLAATLPAAAAAATHTVTIEGMKFVPETLTVKQGDRIVWNNKDVVPHTATAAGAFDSRSIGSGRSWSFVAGKPGRHAYVCTFHPGMKATLVVQ
ncbi:MAG TPA: cupredoxin family copper-binding protein [Ramlibacter sp.]|nr:cupredoxin family copper-binding protein [Ramlibacter sp.]